MNTGTTPRPSQHGLITTVAGKFGDAPACYALEGSIAVTGALVQWLRDNLGIIRASADVEALAASVPDNGDVYFVPAFSGLYAPYWRSDARGVIAGLTRYATAGQIARAALEATAYQTLDVVRAMEQDSGIAIRTLRVDGGMVANELLMQFQADMLNVPVVRPRTLGNDCAGRGVCGGTGGWVLAGVRRSACQLGGDAHLDAVDAGGASRGSDGCMAQGGRAVVRVDELIPSPAPSAGEVSSRPTSRPNTPRPPGSPPR